MSTIFKHLLLTTLILIASSGYAEESIDLHPLSEEMHEQIIQDRQAEWEEVTQNLEDPLSVLIIPIKGYQYAALSSPNAQMTEAEYSPLRMHWIESFSTQDHIFKLEDGSEWSFDENDARVLIDWKPHDIVEITPRQPLPWGSIYSFVVTNRAQNTSVYANWIVRPTRNGVNTAWVYGLNRESLVTNLINGRGERSDWSISPTDAEIFKEWRHDDTIIIGYNNSWLWWFSSYDHILINVNMNEFVRAKIASSSQYLANY